MSGRAALDMKAANKGRPFINTAQNVLAGCAAPLYQAVYRGGLIPGMMSSSSS